MIHFLMGPPGAGKGVVAMQKIVDCLVNDTCPVVTNLAVRPDPWVRVIKRRGKRTFVPELGLRNYLLRQYGKTFDLDKRLLTLNDDQAQEFFRYRGHGCDPLPATYDKDRRLTAIDYGPAANGEPVLFVVDEAWKFWNSRNWQKTGPAVQDYAAQHRKLGDEVWLCTQHAKQVETVIRQVAEDYHVVTNHGNKPLGIFRQPNIFSVAVYSDLPTGNASALQVKPFRLDKKGLGSCFDTSGGVGISGGAGADIGARKRGVPFWVLVVLAVCLLVGVTQIPRAIKLLWGSRSAPKPVARSSAPASSPSLASGVASMLGLSPSNGVASVEPVTMVGYARFLDYWSVRLSDGREFRAGDPRVSAVSDRSVTVSGVTYYYQSPPSAPAVVSDMVPSASDVEALALVPPVGSRRRPLVILSEGLRRGPGGNWVDGPPSLLRPRPR